MIMRRRNDAIGGTSLCIIYHTYLSLPVVDEPIKRLFILLLLVSIHLNYLYYVYVESYPWMLIFLPSRISNRRKIQCQIIYIHIHFVFSLAFSTNSFGMTVDFTNLALRLFQKCFHVPTHDTGTRLNHLLANKRHLRSRLHNYNLLLPKKTIIYFNPPCDFLLG